MSSTLPTLIKIQDKYAAKGLQTIGISIDSVANVREFKKEFKVQYPLLIAGVDVIEITRSLGNKAAGLPYTVVLDRSGRIAARHLGGISEQQLETVVQGLVNKTS